MEFVTKSIDEGDPVDVVYYDFAKAFDKVSIKKLMEKIRAYDIKGKIACWIENWLSNQRQRTVLNGGLPQSGLMSGQGSHRARCWVLYSSLYLLMILILVPGPSTS